MSIPIDEYSAQMESLRASWASDIDRLDGLDMQLGALRKSCRGWLQQLDTLMQRNARLEAENLVIATQLAERDKLIEHQASDIARLQADIDRLLAERLDLVRVPGGE